MQHASNLTEGWFQSLYKQWETSKDTPLSNKTTKQLWVQGVQTWKFVWCKWYIFLLQLFYKACCLARKKYVWFLIIWSISGWSDFFFGFWFIATCTSYVVTYILNIRTDKPCLYSNHLTIISVKYIYFFGTPQQEGF